MILSTLDASLDIGLYVHRYREAMSSSDHASEKLVLVFLYQARCMHEGRDAEMQRETSAKDGERRRRRGEKERRR